MTGLVWDVNKLRIATDAAGIALWSWNVDTDQLELDERGYTLWGIPNTGTITFEALSACIHPEDLDRVRAAFASVTTSLQAKISVADLRIPWRPQCSARLIQR